MLPLQKSIVKVRRFVIYRLLHIDDTPHRLALGIALGLFVAWTPMMGLQMVLVFLLAPVLRANIAVGLPVVWISNPLTFAPLFLANYWLGQKVLALFTQQPFLDHGQLLELLTGFSSLGHLFSNIGNIEFWHRLLDLLWTVGLDLWVGSVLFGLVSGVLGYFASYRLIIWYRTHTPRGRLHVLKMLHKKRHAS